jgi:hypothetical protein
VALIPTGTYKANWDAALDNFYANVSVLPSLQNDVVLPFKSATSHPIES